MNHRPPSPQDLSDFLDRLLSRTALIELAVLLICLLLAAGLARMLQRRAGDAPATGVASLWRTHRLIDGWVWPLLALLLALAAREVLSAYLPVAVFRVAVPVLVSLVIIRFCARVLRVTFPNSQGVRHVERTLSWLVWLGVVLWMTGLLPILQDEMSAVTMKVGSTTLSLRNVVEGALAVVTVLVVVLWLSAAVEAQLLKGARGSRELSVRKIVSNAVRALMVLVGLIAALSLAGIDLTALSVLGGAIGVGLGFGLQKIAANYVSGFVVLAEQSLRIGDLVRVDNFEGHITDINTRYTVIRSGSGRESIVPNEMLITQRVENASLADPHVMLTSVVQVAYGTDIPALQPLLAAAIAAVPRVIAQPAPLVALTAFAADGLELTINYWIDDPQRGQLSVRSEVNLAILRTLDELGIEIPYPQRVVRGVGGDAVAMEVRGAQAAQPGA